MKDNSSEEAEAESPVEVEAAGGASPESEASSEESQDSAAAGDATAETDEQGSDDGAGDDDSDAAPSLDDDDETSQTKVGLPRSGPLSESGQAEATAASEADDSETDSGEEVERSDAGEADAGEQATGDSAEDGDATTTEASDADSDSASTDAESADEADADADSSDETDADGSDADGDADSSDADSSDADSSDADADDGSDDTGSDAKSSDDDDSADDESADREGSGSDTESKSEPAAASATARPPAPPARTPDSDRLAQRGPDGRPRPPAQPGRPRQRPESGERPVLREGLRPPPRQGDPRQGDPRQGDRRRPTRDGRPTPAGARPPRNPADAQRRKSGSRPGGSEVIGKAISGLGNRIGQVESNTQKIARAMVEIVKEGENRKKAYDVLYGEMRQYKENFLWQCQKPLFMDLMSLFDSILRVERKYDESESAAEGSSEAVTEDLRYLKEELLEILYRYDIELIEDHPERLEISFQKPIKRIDSDDPDDDRRVVQYVREGFTKDKTVLRPQEIVVKRYSGAKEA